MAFLTFDKAKLVNLEYSLGREMIRSNRAGSYASTTVAGCNTRKYHGLLVSPIPELDGENHVLLSTLDLTVIQHEKDFNLGIHKYEGDNYIPRGHKYIRDYDATTGSRFTYRVGGVVLTRETMLVQKKEQILVKITLEEATSETWIQFRPFLAFRNIHQLSKANMHASRQYNEVENGIRSRLYEGYPFLYMQLSKKPEFVPVPDWYYNVEYLEEQARGYDYKEDLYVPGYFQVKMKAGESVVFSAATEEINPTGLKKKFQAESALRLPLESFRNCLLNAAQQFIVKREKDTEILAGFPWMGSGSRETFMALPGLLLTTGNADTAKSVLQSMAKRLNDGLFPCCMRKGREFYNSIDAPLWFIWALQQLQKYDQVEIWKTYGKHIRGILESYRKGTHFRIRMEENGLIAGGEPGIPVTWMNASVAGKAVTLRDGYAVEVNALWYNAICQAIEWSGARSAFAKSWTPIKDQVAAAFLERFWMEDKGYLADHVYEDFQDVSVRPNQTIAAAMEHTPLSKAQINSLLEVVKSELLTARGLRTLSPKNVLYEGVYEGDQIKRDMAAHQGTVYPWLLEHFFAAYLKVHKRSGLSLAKEIYGGFEDEMNRYGIGAIGELYDGNPPHDPRGAVSSATSTAALLRVGEMIDTILNQ